MSDFLINADAERTPPLISFWLNPRRTIERIVASQPDYLVLPLAMLGGVASAAAMLTGYGVGSELISWRALLACIVFGALLGVFNLYFFALVVGWFGRKMGGEASAAAVRAVFAWGNLPAILGLAVVLSIAAASYLLVGNVGPEQRLLATRLEYVTAVCALWSIIVTLLMLSRVERFGFWRTIATVALGGLLVPAILALIARTFLFQPFSLPSWSMAPTLLPGDRVFAAKYPYGYSRHSLPFSLPLFSGRVFGSHPARGDVIVFRITRYASTDYVKRVVGLPGDRIQMKEGELNINGTPVKRDRIDDFASDVCGSGSRKVKRWRETLPEGVSYETVDCAEKGYYDNTDIYQVPAGHLFVLGDNRDNSTDSRVLSAVGYIPLENVIARIGTIFFSHDSGDPIAPPAIRYERIGTAVR